jgi:thiamine-monophosphate kinase
MSGEFDFIQQIRSRTSSQANHLICGIGDDAAIIEQRTGCETLISTDLLMENVHFSLEYFPPSALGHKTLAVSLSDIAAMGGRPQYALLSLGIPKTLSPAKKFWQEFFDGYFTLADEHKVTLIGGDTSSSPDKLVIDSIVMGQCEQRQAIRRSGAKVGDAIYVTGKLGASAAGLKLFQQGIGPGNAVSAQRELLKAHLWPQPRVEFAKYLVAICHIHSMTDVSDGLAQDLSHLCTESRVSAILDAEKIPIAEGVGKVAKNKAQAFDLAISGGEDYELLFTTEPDNDRSLRQFSLQIAVPITRLGEIIAPENSPLFLRRADKITPLAARGFDHFS